MSPLVQLLLFLLVLTALSVSIYVLVIKFFYWGSREKKPDKKD
jgi:hypothetical protein